MPIEGLFGYTVQIGGLLHDYATLTAAGGQCAQTAMQIDQRLRHELLFRHVLPRFRRRLFLPFLASHISLAGTGLYRVRLEQLRYLWTRRISIKR